MLSDYWLVSWSRLWMVLLASMLFNQSYSYFAAAQVNGLQADHPIMNFSCAYTPREDSIPVFWINLDRSVVRRKYMETFLSKLGLAHERVRALSMKDMVIPKDIMQKVDNRESLCVLQTQDDPSITDTTSSSSISFKTQSVTDTSQSNRELAVYETLMTQQKGPRKVFIKGVCGSPSNTIKELVSVASHLLAIYQACFSTKFSGKYALILEDDVWTPFDIDFEELIETVPTLNFGILQLFNSKPIALFELFRRYKKAKMLWYDRPVAFDARFLSTFSTGAYIINREVMRPIIAKLIGLNNDWIYLTIIAGNTIPTCKPAICCDTSITVNQFIHDFTHKYAHSSIDNSLSYPNNVNYFIDHYSPTSNLTDSPVQSAYHFNESAPYCLYAPVGYQADSFLYTLAKTWTLTFPLFLDGPGSEDSTIHQHHVLKQHRVAFHRIREYQLKLLKSEVELPHFVKRACPVESLQLPNSGLAANNL